MLAIALTLIGILIGVIATGFVGRYYYVRSVEKKFTAYVYHAGSVLGIDPSVRDQVKIYYQDKEVGNLYELQLLFVNDGERAIRDCIDPLNLTLPANHRIIDASILHTHPEGRSVDLIKKELADGSTRIELPFALLNKNEFFLVKFLLEGSLDPIRLDFLITSDDLPPIISPHYMPLYLKEPARVDWLGIVTGIAGVVLSLVISVGIIRDPRSLFGSGEWWGYLVVASLAILIGVFFFACLGMVIHAGIILPKERKRYSLPSRLRRFDKRDDVGY